METVFAVKLACSIAQFVDFAAKASSAAHKLDQPKTKESINNLIEALLLRTKEVYFQVPDGIGLLSEDDEIFRRLSQKCEKVSSQLLLDLEHLKATSNHGDKPAEHKDSDAFEQQFEDIRKDLNENLARFLWLSIIHMIRELDTKNSRLNASRTKEIQELSTDINASFKEIKSNGPDDARKAAIWSRILTSVQKAVDYSAEQVFLSALHFWTMNRRQELIPKEHTNTFEWILEPSISEQQSSQPIVNFAEWLTTDAPVYWISGKPGSGKSTLTKFIAESPKTMERLRQWAGDDRLVTASFYFWSSAKDQLQKSSAGLLRSILFQILRQCPELTQYAFPEQWKDSHLRGSRNQLGRADSTTTELLAAYQHIADQLSTMKVKFCFFIDGLDEYQGQSSDIVQLIQSLSKTPNLKTCISSRPWNEFEVSFGGSNPWKLYVHQLTETDMKLYVEDLLGSNDRFSKLENTSKDGEVQVLVSSIVEAAQGVFLWVFLVVRSLLDGLTDTDQISNLQNRLAAIPNDLDNYFEQMLLKTDEGIREQTAHTFLITLHAAEKLPLMSYWFIQELSLHDVMATKLQPLSKDTALGCLKQTAKQLNTYSSGLLKVNGMEGDPSPELEEHQWLFEFRVDFLHRTVADFLGTAQMQELMREWSAKSFSVDSEICKACLATIKRTPPIEAMFSDSSRILSTLHLFLSHAKLMRSQSSEDLQNSMIDELVSSLKTHDATSSHVRGMLAGPGNYWVFESSFDFAILYHCVSYGLGSYVCLKIDSKELEFPEPLSGLLSGCLSWDPRMRRGKLTLDIDTIQLLLQRNLDPNLPWGDRNLSFWQQLLSTTYSSHLRGLLTQNDREAIICAMDYGADQQATVELWGYSRSGNIKAVDIVEKIMRT